MHHEPFRRDKCSFLFSSFFFLRKGRSRSPKNYRRRISILWGIQIALQRNLCCFISIDSCTQSKDLLHTLLFCRHGRLYSLITPKLLLPVLRGNILAFYLSPASLFPITNEAHIQTWLLSASQTDFSFGPIMRYIDSSFVVVFLHGRCTYICDSGIRRIILTFFSTAFQTLVTHIR
jgi:hypothetical protein